MVDLKIKHAKELAYKVLDNAGAKEESCRCSASLGPHGYMSICLPLTDANKKPPSLGIMSAITILACCKYAERHIEYGKEYTAAIACITQCQAAIKISPAISKRNGRKAKGMSKAWYSYDLNKMIEAMLIRRLSAKKVWRGLGLEKVSGEIKEIELDDSYIIIDSILIGNEPRYPASKLMFSSIKKRITEINKKRQGAYVHP
ncbi:MAG: hypothetical protein Q9M20_08830 [Mariprofundaceae bacterium]|nr:hypothetical protein [Mariprofundaceae bacterium]